MRSAASELRSSAPTGASTAGGAARPYRAEPVRRRGFATTLFLLPSLAPTGVAAKPRRDVEAVRRAGARAARPAELAPVGALLRCAHAAPR